MCRNFDCLTNFWLTQTRFRVFFAQGDARRHSAAEERTHLEDVRAADPRLCLKIFFEYTGLDVFSDTQCVHPLTPKNSKSSQKNPSSVNYAHVVAEWFLAFNVRSCSALLGAGGGGASIGGGGGPDRPAAAASGGGPDPSPWKKKPQISK